MEISIIAIITISVLIGILIGFGMTRLAIIAAFSLFSDNVKLKRMLDLAEEANIALVNMVKEVTGREDILSLRECREVKDETHN